MSTHPKVFISYSQKDLNRFVLGFASRLRQHGVDAWLDTWEMSPGDSLVDKIFEEGIRNAAAFIVVISANSIGSRWVREELNAAFVEKVNRGSRLIPVVIDDCEVPQSLRSTVWERIDPTEYESSLQRIVDAIFGQSRKPIVGAAPSYLTEEVIPLPSLSATDTLILKASCELFIDSNRRLISPKDLPAGSSLATIPESVLGESLDILESEGYVRQHKHLGRGPYPYVVTPSGMETYCRAYLADYSQLVSQISYELVNNKPPSNIELQARVRIPLAIVDHVLDRLESYGHITMSKELSSRHAIVNVRPTLKRALDI